MLGGGDGYSGNGLTAPQSRRRGLRRRRAAGARVRPPAAGRTPPEAGPRPQRGPESPRGPDRLGHLAARNDWVEEWLPLGHPEKGMCPEAPRRSSALAVYPGAVRRGSLLQDTHPKPTLRHPATFNPFFLQFSHPNKATPRIPRSDQLPNKNLVQRRGR